MDRRESVDRLVQAVMGMNYGEVLTFNEIGSIIDQQHGTMTFNYVVNAARKHLIAAGHMIVNVRGVGYKVCPPDNYTSEGVRQVRQGARKIDRGAKIVSHAPVNDMSPIAREAHNRVNDRLVTLQAAMAGASVEIHMLSKTNHPLLVAK